MITYIIIDLTLAIIPAKIASNKGRDSTTWYIYGCLLFIIALVHSLCLNDISNENITGKISTETIDVNRLPDKMDINAKVSVTSYGIIKKNENVILQLKIKNLGVKRIRAIKLHLKAMNDFGDDIKPVKDDCLEMVIQDLSIDPLKEQTKEFSLESELRDARKFEFTFCQICYEDNEVETCGFPRFVETCQNKIEPKYLKIVQENYPQAGYYMTDSNDYWQCICGNVNSNRFDKCTSCNISKKEAEAFSKDNIGIFYAKSQEEEKEQEIDDKRNSCVILGAILIIIVVAFLRTI